MALKHHGRGHFPFSASLGLLAVVLIASTWLWSGPSDPMSVRIVPRAENVVGDVAAKLGSDLGAGQSTGSYSCSKKNPCSNGACCGPSGYCGFGSEYCGIGCQSNCNATAQCGQYAATPGQTCPLNVCCSEFGFCGTTENFCNDKCQSNCVLNPSPPSKGSSIGILENKVIGYYESWSARKDCHKVSPSDLPLDALTHVNFAFAYIDPKTYEIVTMDGETPAKLFQETTNIKIIKPDLSVFVSVGGWTFSDNKTATQPVYGDIAADPKKRQKFADNVVAFLKQNAFDGLDIDWEYPGASDRGGKPEDTKNYVLLLKTLQETFAASGSNYGLTFTAPSSYWYLRWFDLENMLKYADWINLMSYDLHGVWDATDPIGSIVQAHTNLTEIKQATELFWRVNVPPEKIVMGFGFYGRSFTLADPSCTKPGCPFKGASTPGPCTDTGGILAYYEIMAALNGNTGSSKRSTITPVHDKKDAVNYFTYDNNQWVSYDDATTFGQKVDWANTVGLGGSMIWASDLDTDHYTAHSSLTNKPIKSNPELQAIDKALSSPASVIQDLAGSNGQKCFVYDGDCVHLDDNAAMSQACGSGFTPVGWDDAGCGSGSCHCGKPVCCPTKSAPKNCIWRGDDNGGGAGSDCSAQCRPGEINVKGIGSSWGGGYLNDGDTDKCGRGYKVFCCPDPDYSQVTAKCSYADCGKDCPAGQTSVFKKYDSCWSSGQNYCCPNPVSLHGCHWEGGSGGDGDCANANCKATEVEVDRAQYGDQSTACDWGRKKAMCCTIHIEPPKPATCSADLCTELPGFCPVDDDDESADNWVKKDLIPYPGGEYGDNLPSFEKRGKKQTYTLNIDQLTLVIIAAAYPSLRELYGVRYAAQALRSWFRLMTGVCIGPTVDRGNFPGSSVPSKIQLRDLQSEHVIDRQVLKSFVETIITGDLPSGRTFGLPSYSAAQIQSKLHAPNSALAARPPVGGPDGARPDTINGRLTEAFGSKQNAFPFMAVDSKINGPKGRIMAGNAAASINRIRRLARRAVARDTNAAADTLLSAIRSGFSVFDYLRQPEASLRWNAVRHQGRLQVSYIETDARLPFLSDWWEAWSADFFSLRQRQAQDWAREAIQEAAQPYIQARNNGRNLATYAAVINALEGMLREIPNMIFPPDYSMRPPHPP